MTDNQTQDPITQQSGGQGLFHGVPQDVPKEPEQHVAWASSNTKEIEPVHINTESTPTQIQTEMELPKEVREAGVKTVPTTVSLPPNLISLGIKTAPPKQADLIKEGNPTLPLSDEQIAYGLKQDFFSSWRWFSEWCVRKLKQAHLVVRNVHGKFIRVKS